MKPLIDVKYIMTVNQFSSITMFWDCNHFVGNVENLCKTKKTSSQHNHFAGNTKQNKADKGQKIGIIDHLTESFQAVCSDEYMKKFKAYFCFLS